MDGGIGGNLNVDKIYKEHYINTLETNMLTKVMRMDDNTITIPGLDQYRGKVVEITVREKKENKKQDLTKLFALRGKISIDSAEINKLYMILVDAKYYY